MSELTSEHVGQEPADERRTGLPDGAIVALLVLDGALLGVFGLLFTPLHTNGIPVPMGAVLSFLVLPWLVARAGEVSPRPTVAGAPLAAWVLVIVVLVLLGPGGDQMLIPNDWAGLALVAALFAGLWALRGVTEAGYRGHDG